MSDTIRISLTPDAVSVTRDGDSTEVVVTVQNAGTTVDQYAVELDGLPTTWYSLSASSVALFPQDKDEAKLVLHPPKGIAKAGVYPFTVTVLSRADPSRTSRVEGTLRVAAVASFEIDMSPRKVIGRRGRYRVTMRNGGNSDLDVALTASDAEEACRYALVPATPHLTPNQQATAVLTVRPRRGAFAGPKKNFDFQVKAQPGGGDAKTLAGQFVFTPRLGSWKPIILLVLLILLAAAVFAAVRSQGGISGVQYKAPGWKQQATDTICQHVTLAFCPATSNSGSAPGRSGSGVPSATPSGHGSGLPVVLHTATPAPPSASPTAPAATQTETPAPPTSTQTALPPSATETAQPPSATTTAPPSTPTVTTRPPSATTTAQPATPTETTQPSTATVAPSDTPVPPTASPVPPKPTVSVPNPADPAAPVKGATYFSHTHHNLSGTFLSFWEMYGGLNVFGYPRTEPFRENDQIEQYTDRFLIELVNGQMRTAPLGRELTAGRAFPRVAPFTSTATRMYFASTGHSLSGLFLTYWQSHHGSVVLGAPIAEPTHEKNNDGSGRTYLVQWFENGRLEYHPEIANAHYKVELGLVGKQDLQRRGWLP